MRRRPSEQTATELLREEPVEFLAGLTSKTSDESIDASILSAVHVSGSADCLRQNQSQNN